MDLPWKRHFCIVCSCEAACATEITRAQYDLRPDPTAVLRSLSAKDQADFAKFYAEHQAMGHEPRPDFVDLAPMPQT